MTNDVSVVIPFCFYEIKDTIKALSKQKYPGKKEIIVIYDNPSAPLDSNFRKFFKKFGAKIIENKENLGLAGCYNLGIRTAKYKNVLLMHEDCVPTTNNMVKNLVKTVNKNPEYIVEAKIVIPLEIWSKYDYWNKILIYRYLGFPPGPSLGKTTIFKKSIIKKVGYFDDKTFKTAGEDSDFVFRMKQKGIKTIATDDIVNHNHRAKKANLAKLLKKGWQMAEAHGAWKRKHKFARMGRFDFEAKFLFFLILLLGIVLWNLPLFIIGIAPFVISPISKTIKNYKRSKWLPGLITYPFIGFLMIFVQLAANIKGVVSGKQGSRLYQNVKSEETNL
jgi:GT2 family glycosyltransferase